MSQTDENKRAERPEPDAAENDNAGAATPAEQIASLTSAVDELRDKFLRAVAEGDNLRKRAEREVAEARSYGISGFARDVIGAADNLSRTLEAITPEARAAADGTLKALLEGVELTRREFDKALAKHNVRPLDPKGEKFDPNFHQAMFELDDPDAAPGTVVQVMQTGYAIGDRVLRPALVAVAKNAKGGSK
jgi:molecular chaperone GrpE